MRIAIVTLFPELIASAARHGITGRALERRLWSLECVNPRDFATDRHRTIDDRPYGGGPGMVMMAEPLEHAVAAARAAVRGVEEGAEAAPSPFPERPGAKVLYLSPQGPPLTHARVVQWASLPALVLVAGRYEGVDERVLERVVDEEVSIGDFVVSGGELPALLLVDAVVRQLPHVLNDDQSKIEESFVAGLLDCPHYTRPEVHAGVRVPEVLLSGHHADISRWRLKQSLGRTWLRRPELLADRPMTAQERVLLEEFKRELGRGPSTRPGSPKGR